MLFNRLFVGFVAVIILVILAIVLLTGGGKKTPPRPSTVMSLPSYSTTDATVSMTIDGHINGDDAHRQIKITVGEGQREMDIIQGYAGYVLNRYTFYNTQPAYSVFLHAINYAGFLTGLKNSGYPSDDSGECATGFRYVFELDQNGKTLSRLWASSCGMNIGTAGGNSQLITSLFQEQITNYFDIADNVAL